ncbi:MAG: type III toxin-antitoxin system ToxN/AbiQ family toxin [Erysipelotrichales bacterium]|nr:type III toxin-antitoxin system ToxN/AbiQ family toxin [Erysipelotrichales bacterium]
MNDLKWYTINDNYTEYLRSFEPRIPKNNYGPDKFKPLFGIIFEKNGFAYVCHVTSPKPKHEAMPQTEDFKKIYDPNNPNLLIGCINLNYMFPVPKSELTEVKYDEIEKYRLFKNEKEKTQYIGLLKKEMEVISSSMVRDDARYLYDIKKDDPERFISKRLLEYQLLEEKAKSWHLARDSFQYLYSKTEAENGWTMLRKFYDGNLTSNQIIGQRYLYRHNEFKIIAAPDKNTIVSVDNSGEKKAIKLTLDDNGNLKTKNFNYNEIETLEKFEKDDYSKKLSINAQLLLYYCGEFEDDEIIGRKFRINKLPFTITKALKREYVVASDSNNKEIVISLQLDNNNRLKPEIIGMIPESGKFNKASDKTFELE